MKIKNPWDLFSINEAPFSPCKKRTQRALEDHFFQIKTTLFIDLFPGKPAGFFESTEKKNRVHFLNPDKHRANGFGKKKHPKLFGVTNSFYDFVFSRPQLIMNNILSKSSCSGFENISWCVRVFFFPLPFPQNNLKIKNLYLVHVFMPNRKSINKIMAVRFLPKIWLFLNNTFVKPKFGPRRGPHK